jgi:uncharacterized membrane protein
MAIVITLLAFEFKVPIENTIDNLQTLTFLQELLPSFFVFTLSFLTISIMWINHHYITSKIELVNHKTVWANSFLLLAITMIPFATQFLGKNPSNQVALILYSITMLVASISFTVLKYSSVPKGARTDGREIFKHVGVYAYTFAIFVAIFMPQLTYFVLLVPPLSYILPKNS